MRNTPIVGKYFLVVQCYQAWLLEIGKYSNITDYRTSNLHYRLKQRTDYHKYLICYLNSVNLLIKVIRLYDIFISAPNKKRIKYLRNTAKCV